MPAYMWNAASGKYQPLAGGAVPPSPRRYSISQMEADIAAGRPVYWAHRGGSANWSEMTMHAYTNAVAHGARALEFSTRPTLGGASSGTWIGMHDTTLDRVTNLSGNVNAYTWEQLEGTPVTAPVPGGYLTKLADFLAAFPEQLLIVDAKSQGWSTFSALLKTVPNWQEQVIVKMDGQWEQTTVFQWAKDDGFKTAGYWYPSNYAEHLPPRLAFTDYIGMQHDASPAVWEELRSYGKPMWGHVLANRSQLDASLAGGASILQCADVTGLVPPA